MRKVAFLGAIEGGVDLVGDTAEGDGVAPHGFVGLGGQVGHARQLRVVGSWPEVQESVENLGRVLNHLVLVVGLRSRVDLLVQLRKRESIGEELGGKI